MLEIIATPSSPTTGVATWSPMKIYSFAQARGIGSIEGITKFVAYFLSSDNHAFLAWLSAITLTATHNAGIIAAG